jgi:hypothetical protein
MPMKKSELGGRDRGRGMAGQDLSRDVLCAKAALGRLGRQTCRHLVGDTHVQFGRKAHRTA